MTRFFFDYETSGSTILDYRGQEFRNAAGALEFAREIAVSLKQSLSNEWAAWSIEVRTQDGQKFYSLPIAEEASSAA